MKTETVPVKDWFVEKTQQVEPSKFTAFGVELSSRYGRVSELIEMLQVAYEFASCRLEQFVKGVYCDSKTGCFFFQLDPSLVKGSESEKALFAIARRRFAHFDWDGDEIFADQ
jgi:hypothetical protein